MPRVFQGRAHWVLWIVGALLAVRTPDLPAQDVSPLGERPSASAAAPERATDLQALRFSPIGRELNRAVLSANETAILDILQREPRLADVFQFSGLGLLACALREGLTNVVEYFLRRGLDVNTPVPNSPAEAKGLPLHLAASAHQPALVRRLLSAGAAVNATNAYGQTPLFLAVSPRAMPMANGPLRPPGPMGSDLQQAEDTLKTLLAAGADVFAVLNRNSWIAGATVDLLLTNATPLSMRSAQGDTLLHAAAKWSRLEALEFLLQAGLSVNATNHAGWTPLHSVAQRPEMFQQFVRIPLGSPARGFMVRGPPPQGIPGRIVPPPPPSREQLAARLLAAGARHDVFTAAGLGATTVLAELAAREPASIHRRDSVQRTPLHWAVVAGATNSVRWLLDHGADLAAADQDGNTALHLAASPFRHEALALLLAAGAPLEVTNRVGYTPLACAVGNPVTTAAELLLRYGAKVEPEVPGAVRPLEAFFHSPRDKRLFDLLLKHGARLDQPTREGVPLVYLVQDSADFLEEMVTHGADINARDPDGNTLLHHAMWSPGQMLLWTPPSSVLRRALEGSRWGGQALNWLQRRGLIAPPPQPTNILAVELLLRLGADPNATNAFGRAALHLLCGDGHFGEDIPSSRDLVQRLLRAGARLEARDRAGQTPLLYSLRKEQFAWAQVLLELGADALAADAEGNTALHYLASLGQPYSAEDEPARKLLDRLLERGLSCNARNRRGETPLFLTLSAARYPRHAAEVLLEHGADPLAADHAGDTFLHKLFASGSYWWSPQELFGRWVPPGANLNVTNHAGDTLLHAALRSWRADFVKPLTERGLRPDARNLAGETPLLLGYRKGFEAKELWPPGVERAFHEAIAAGDTNTLAAYLKAEPRLASTTNINGTLAITLAARLRQPQIAQLFRAAGSPVTAEAAVACGWVSDLPQVVASLSPKERDDLLFVAVEKRQVDALRWLLEHGANPNVQDFHGCTPRFTPYLSRSPQVVELLDRFGAKPTIFDALATDDNPTAMALLAANPTLVHATNGWADTPLIVAMVRTNEGLFHHLLGLGAKVDLVTREGATLLHISAAVGRVDFASTLLARGLDPNARDQSGETPLHWAACAGTTNVAAVLRAAGADVQARSREDGAIGGNTPLHAAVQFGQASMVAWLLAAGADPGITNAAGATPLEIARQEPRFRSAGRGAWRFIRPGRGMDETTRASIVALLESARVTRSAGE